MILKELAAGGMALKTIFDGEPYPVFERDYAAVLGVMPPLIAALRLLQAMVVQHEADAALPTAPYAAAFCEAQWYGRMLLADPHTKTLGHMVRDLPVDMHAAIDPDEGFRKPRLSGLLHRDRSDLDDRIALLIIQCEAFRAATQTLFDHVEVRVPTVTLIRSDERPETGTQSPGGHKPEGE